MRLQTSSTNGIPMLQGSRYRATHQSSVDAVLGAGVRRVSSRGARFFNKDRWPLRTFVIHFCAWVSQNRGRKAPPTLVEIQSMCNNANAERVSDPQIVIASTPEKLPLAVALALIGGGYHEAWHTKYSRRRDVSPREMKQVIDVVWDRVSDWSKFGRAILDWSNIVEDIRIERAGCEEFPGSRPKMEDLQGFILDQEEDARREAAAKGVPEADLNRAQTVISGTFRDVGLGYNTERQRRAFDAYVERNAAAVKFVIDGPLSDLLRETIALGPHDDTACLRIAMSVLAVITEASQNDKDDEQDDQDDEQDDQDGQGGQGGQVACPNCGSPNVKAKKVSPGKGLLVCGRCGYQEEIDLPESKSKGQGGGQGIEMEQDESDESDESDGAESEGSDDGSESDSKGSKGSKKDQKGSKGGSDDDEGDSDDDSDESEGSKGSKKDDSDESEGSKGSDDAEGEGSKGSDDADDGSEDGSEGSEGESSESDGGKADEGAQGAGGHQGNTDPIDGWDFAAEVAAGYLEDADDADGNGLMDGATALEDAFDGEKEQEDDRCKRGEAPYRPYDASLDTADFTAASRRGKSDDERRAAELLSSVRSECAYLRARLRNIVKAVEQTNVEHGTNRGRGLSERMFVDDVACLRNGEMPNRAYYDEESQIDTSMAAAIVLDESGSMSSRLQLATQAMLALTEPLDALGCATMAVGFRDGSGYADTSGDDGRGNHFRTESVHIDVFKAFGESFRSVKWRFANTQATGGTPMADGIQYALEGLTNRPEAHRVVFVVTDGEANYNHRPVIKRQIRLAREAGILIVGVGIGSGASYVTTMFDDHVYTTKLSDLPQKLVTKLNQLLDFRGLKRGRRLAKTA